MVMLVGQIMVTTPLVQGGWPALHFPLLLADQTAVNSFVLSARLNNSSSSMLVSLTTFGVYGAPMSRSSVLLTVPLAAIVCSGAGTPFTKNWTVFRLRSTATPTKFQTLPFTAGPIFVYRAPS